MDNEVYSFALKNTIDEVKEVCPGIKNAFLFRQDGEIIARDGNTSEETTVRAIDAIDDLTSFLKVMRVGFTFLI
jgi:hypothetical protein